MGNKLKVFMALAVVVVLLFAGAGSVLAQEVPPIPADYSGYVYVGGAKAGAGLQVSAKIEDYTSASVTTDANGYYFFLVVGPSDAAYIGKTIHFYVNGVEATETDTFAAGSSHEDFALHIAALPPAGDGGGGDGGGGGGGTGGGGGGGAPPAYLATNLFGTVASFRIGETGETLETIIATSADGKLSLTIPAGTIALDEYGNPLSSLTVVVDPSPPPPPEDANIIGLAYSFGPSGANFNPPMTLEYTYCQACIPEGVAEEDLVLAYYDEGTGEWVECPCIVDPVTHRIIATVSHLTTFAIIAHAPPSAPAPAAFSLSNLTVQPAEVQPKEAVTISAAVANTGGTEGSYTVVLEINGVKEAEKAVTIAAGGSKTVTFSVTKEETASYSVTVDGLSKSFTVVAPAPAPAAFSLSNLSIQPAEVQPKEAVTISAAVANTGGTEGSYTVVLKLNGVKEAEKTVTIAAGGSQTVTFSVAKDNAASYGVTVDGLSGSFTVIAPPAVVINWPVLGGIIGAVVIVALLVFFLARRRAY